MPADNFEAFKNELATLKAKVASYKKKTLRDELLLERLRTLFRTWTFIIAPTIEPQTKNNKREFLKLGRELESIAKLTNKFKPITEYRKRINRAIQLSNSLVLYLPIEEKPRQPNPISGLFLPSIPDLPAKFVPNAILGSRSKMEAFVEKHSFDKSVFIMIRYRKRNNALIKAIKSTLKKTGYFGVLASEHNLTDDLYNPIACLLCCSKGIAVFDQAEKQAKYNPNVAYELGMLHLLSRECLILKHKSLRTLHTDILMKLYSKYQTPQEACSHTENWIKQL